VGGWPSADVGFRAALEGFKAEYPNIEVEIEMAEVVSYQQALTTALAAGQGAPDVAMINDQWIGNYRNSPSFVNLLEAPYNAEQYRNDFTAYKWDQGYSADKKRFIAFSQDIGPGTFFYRADIFAEVGLPTEPEEVAEYMSTWEGVLDVAKKVHIPGQRWLLHNSVVLYQELFALMDFYNEDLSLRLDREGDIEVLDAVIEMRKNKLDMNVDLWSPEGVSAVDNGAVAAVILGSWFGGFLKADFDPDGAGNWRATTLPGKNIPASNIGGSFIGIPSQSEHPAEAWEFIKYMLATKKGQNDIFLAIDYFPSYKPAWDDPIYDEPDPYFGGQKTRALWKNIASQLNQGFHSTIMDVTVNGLILTSVSTGIEQGLDAQGIKELFRRDIEANTAELRRQQIQVYQDAGVWNE
jgi:multiple sugar transport system substrate-binding protein